MKQISRNVFLITVLFLSSYQTADAMGSRRPKVKPIPVETKPIPPDNPTPTQPKTKYIEQIEEIAENSKCMSYSWKERGRAPAGYIKGMSISFARSLCRLISPEKGSVELAAILSKADSGNSSKDALSHYRNNISLLPIKLDISGTEPLRAVYVLGIGLGMRESSGKYCEGWDRSAGSNRPSSSAEAGIFQTSYDSIGSSPELSKLYSEYKTTDKQRCFLDTFKEGVSCKNNSNLGTGSGADFQSFSKSCPAFSTEYAMTMLRVRRAHYGPINRKEAEVNPSCDKLLISVQNLIVQDQQNACLDIF